MAKKTLQNGVRINKYISDSGLCSRREADQMIVDERVTINGEPATLGSRVIEGDKVKVDGETLHPALTPAREVRPRSDRHTPKSGEASLRGTPRRGREGHNVSPKGAGRLSGTGPGKERPAGRASKPAAHKAASDTRAHKPAGRVGDRAKSAGRKK